MRCAVDLASRRRHDHCCPSWAECDDQMGEPISHTAAEILERILAQQKESVNRG
jgi:hypothetical protein